MDREINPWDEYPEIWKTKSEFFTWLRGGLRNAIWKKYPPKIIYKDSQKYKPDSEYKGRAKNLITCALTGDVISFSSAEVDHIEGNVSLRDWGDVLPFVRHLCASKDNMQVVSPEAHKIKSYAEKMGISFEEADIEKRVISICKNKGDLTFLKSHGIIPAPNARLRRGQVREQVNKERYLER